MTGQFASVMTGDELWIINSFQTNAFEANVTEVTPRTITVHAPEKDAIYVFDMDGNAIERGVSASTLAFDDDWRIKVILDRKEHALNHEIVIQAASQFRKEPTVENGKALREATEKWKLFVSDADPVALVTTTMDEYLVEKMVKP